MNCNNRVKPKLLRDIKTEALLVFIRTTLEQYFHQVDSGIYHFELSTNEDNVLVYSSLKSLLEELQDTVINSSYIRSLLENANKNSTLKILLAKEEPLIFYYDVLVKSIEQLLQNGDFWIPEFIVICLLSEWLLEEEKSAYFYPYLKNVDYMNLINIYEKRRNELEKEKKEVVMNMYKISSKLIENLKNAKYKINKNRKKSR